MISPYKLASSNDGRTPSGAHQQGVALMIVILVFALVTILSVGMYNRQSLFIQQAGNIAAQTQAYEFALTAEKVARAILKEDWDKDKKDGFFDDLESISASLAYPFENALLEAQFDDVQGRLNLNDLVNLDGSPNTLMIDRFKRLFTRLNLDTAKLEVIIDWLDEDQNGLISYKEWKIVEQFLPEAMMMFAILDFDMDDNISFYEYDINKTAEYLQVEDAIGFFHADLMSLYPTFTNPSKRNLEAHDQNMDGKIQIEEYVMKGSGLITLVFMDMIKSMGPEPFETTSAEMLPILIALDKNGDNKITNNEYSDFAKRLCLGANKLPEESFFILFDSDYSQTLDLFEVGDLEGFLYIFETMDLNQNFELEFNEIQDLLMGFTRYDKFKEGKLIFYFGKMDKNNDDELTLNESGLSLENFQKIDKNNDMSLSRREIYAK